MNNSRMSPKAPLADSLLSAAEALLPEVVQIRRRLHRHPEIGLQLPFTQSVVVEELEKLGLTATTGRSTTSATAVIEGAGPGPTILLRADMDALPLQEDTGLDFASDVDGAMHACGHDTHVAMLLGAAKLLLERRGDLAGRVLLMFQPGEEGHHGARYMLEEGLLDAAGERAEAAFALHISTRYANRTINVRPGPLLASADRLQLVVRGRGGHASAPHLALDPIVVAAEIILALQTMVTRTVDTFDPAVVTIAHVKAGTTNNIIPETAFVEGTIRTLSEATRATVHAGIRRLVEGIAAAHGATAELTIDLGFPVTLNDPEFTAYVVDVARELIGADQVLTLDAPIMGAEDFSYVLQKVPGAMAFVGARPPAEEPLTAPQNHSNKVVFAEDAMMVGVAVYTTVALEYASRAKRA
jgi:amidohydrolase